MYPILYGEGAVAPDTCAQDSVATFKSRVEDSLDSTCTKAHKGSLNSSLVVVRNSQSPQKNQQSPTPTQKATDTSPAAIPRNVNHCTCPHVSPEYSTNTPKAQNSTLSVQEFLEPALSIQLVLEHVTTVQKSLLTSQPEENGPGISTLIRGALITSLPAHKALRPFLVCR